jgi:hypothetical protein
MVSTIAAAGTLVVVVVAAVVEGAVVVVVICAVVAVVVVVPVAVVVAFAVPHDAATSDITARQIQSAIRRLWLPENLFFIPSPFQDI